MTISSMNGSLFTALSKVDGQTLSTLNKVDGQTILSTPSTPSGIANIWDWWEPSREGLANHDPIGTLTGQFAANNFTSTGTDRPEYLTAQLNGLGVAQFGSTFMSGPNASALTAGHFWAVMKAGQDPGLLDGNTPWQIGTVATASTYDWWPFTDGVVYIGAGSTTRRSTINPTLGLAAWRVCEVVTTSSEYTVTVDGSEQLFTSATNTVGFLSSLVIGRAVISTTSHWNGAFAGLYLFSAKLSATPRSQMVSYINSRFGLSIV